PREEDFEDAYYVRDRYKPTCRRIEGEGEALSSVVCRRPEESSRSSEGAPAHRTRRVSIRRLDLRRPQFIEYWRAWARLRTMLPREIRQHRAAPVADHAA